MDSKRDGPCDRHSVERLHSEAEERHHPCDGHLGGNLHQDPRRPHDRQVIIDCDWLIHWSLNSLAKFCPRLERLEFRWDNDTLRLIDLSLLENCNH